MLLRWATVAFCISFSVLAQDSSITGFVRDINGAPVTGAEVKVRNRNTNELRAVQTGETGEFTIAELSSDSYDLTVEKAGFKMLRESDLELDVDETARLDLKLEIGSMNESVEVRAESPVLNTESAARGAVITNKEMVEVPLDGRDFGDLVLLVPGVGRKPEGGSGSNFSINGTRSDNVNFIIDGFSDRNPRGGTAEARPNLDAMQEFKVQTSGYPSEYGRLAGGVVNMVLKSGTNDIHGSLFEFLRNDALDARNFFDAGKSELRRNQFGSTLGGPVYLPKLYRGRNRTFFFFSWESSRQVQGNNRIGVVPMLLERAGDFGQTKDPLGNSIPLHDPLAKGTCDAKSKAACFPGNKIPASRLDAVAGRVLSYYPFPNRLNAQNNFQVNKLQDDDFDSYLFRIDHAFSANNTLSARYLIRPTFADQPFASGGTGQFANIVSTHQHLAGLTYTRLFSPVLVNEARMGFIRTTENDHANSAGVDYASQFGISGSTTDPHFVGFPLLTISGQETIGDGAGQPLQFAVNSYEFADTMTLSKSNHLLKWGAGIIRSQTFEPFNNNNRGTFNFLGNVTNAPFADFLLGYPETATRQVGSPVSYLLSTGYGFFVQDDFRATSQLTLNFGLRYEISKPPAEKYGRLGNFVPGLDQIVIASDRTLPNLNAVLAQANLSGKVVVASTVHLPSSLVNTNYDNFAPRFGFAWRPFGGVRTVIRGGYGIFYGGSAIQPIRDDLTRIYPFALSQTFNRSTSNVNLVTLENPFPSAATPGLAGTTNTNGYEANPPSQYVQQYNFTTQHEVGAGLVIEAAYVGSRGVHLGRRYDLNQPYFVPSLKSNGAYPRPYAGFNTINYYSFGSSSTFNSGQFSVQKRLSNGMFLLVNYTYAKSIDDASQISGNSTGGYPGAQNSRDLRAERGRSDFDQGHSFNTLFSWQVPWKRNALVRDWQVGGTGRAYTGQPFTPRVSNTNSSLGQANRPDRTTKGKLANPTVNGWFDLAAFPQVPTGAYRFGNSGRNILDGPGYLAFNASLIRNFKVRETMKLQFRYEVFNLMNHTNLHLPVDMVNAPNGATVTAADPARTMQLGARLQF